METPNTTIITKKLNGSISVITEGDKFTLPVRSTLLEFGDNVVVRDASDVRIASFNFNTVQKLVVEVDGGPPVETVINDVDTLYDGLDADFFLK